MLARILIDRSSGGGRQVAGCGPSSCSGPRRGTWRSGPACCAATRSTWPFKGTVQLDRDENALVANGNLIRILYAESPDKAD